MPEYPKDRFPRSRNTCAIVGIAFFLHAGLAVGGASVDERVKAANVMMEAYYLQSDSTFQIRNYTEYEIKTCFYNPEDFVRWIHLPLDDDKDNCISTPAHDGETYGRDNVKWSWFPSGYTISKHVHAKVFRWDRPKPILGIERKRKWIEWCTRKDILHPKRFNVLEDCRTTVVREAPRSFLKTRMNISHGADFLHWHKAHVEDISYFVARDDDYVYVGFRGTDSGLPANCEMNADVAPTSGRHSGWWKVSKKAYDVLFPHIKDWAGWPHDQKKPILVAGHSMGGALSMYIGYLLMREGDGDEGYEDVRIVTFGAPRTSTDRFAKDMNRYSDTSSVTVIERLEDEVPDSWIGGYLGLLDEGNLEARRINIDTRCKDPHAQGNYYGYIRRLMGDDSEPECEPPDQPPGHVIHDAPRSAGLFCE